MFSKMQGQLDPQSPSPQQPSQLSTAGPSPQLATATPRSGPAAPTDGSMPSRSVIQQDLVIKGAIIALGELELHGLVEGDVVARRVVIGESATIRGDLLGESVTISGDVRGEVAAHSVHLVAGARYFGDIRRGKLSIEEGAMFEGSVRALDDAGARDIEQRLAEASKRPNDGPLHPKGSAA